MGSPFKQLRSRATKFQIIAAAEKTDTSLASGADLITTLIAQEGGLSRDGLAALKQIRATLLELRPAIGIAFSEAAATAEREGR